MQESWKEWAIGPNRGQTTKTNLDARTSPADFSFRILGGESSCSDHIRCNINYNDGVLVNCPGHENMALCEACLMLVTTART
jgi:hypothetical protein